MATTLVLVSRKRPLEKSGQWSLKLQPFLTKSHDTTWHELSWCQRYVHQRHIIFFTYIKIYCKQILDFCSKILGEFADIDLVLALASALDRIVTKTWIVLLCNRDLSYINMHFRFQFLFVLRLLPRSRNKNFVFIYFLSVFVVQDVYFSFLGIWIFTH